MSAHEFPRSARLLSAADYASVFRNSRRFSGQYVTILAHKSGQPARLGLAIAKKKAKRAIDRNRLKRLIRESFRYRRCQLHGVELVVMNKDGAVKASNAEIAGELHTLMTRIAPN